MPKRLTNLRIREVSSVDRGAGVGVKVALMKRDDGLSYWEKRDFSDKQRAALADSGKALPDGSFPIENGEDLENAVHDVGRAKDPGKAKAHIISRARSMGMTDKLPDDWKGGDDADKRDLMARANYALQKSVDSILNDDELEDKTAALDETMRQYNEFTKTVVAGDGAAKGDDPMSEEIKKQVDALTVQVAKLMTENAILKMSDQHKDYMDAKNMSDEEKSKFAAMEPGERDGYMKDNPCNKKLEMAPEVMEKLLKTESENADLKKRLAVIEARERTSEFKKKATDLGMPEAFGEVLMKAEDGDKEAFKKIERAIAGLAKQESTAILFKEFGSSQGGGGDAHDQLLAKAAELRKADPTLTQEKAFAKVYVDPANAELVKMEKANPRLRAA